MDKYKVKINPKAAGDIDHIYEYLAEDRLAPESAKRQAKRLKTAILKLDTFPQSHQGRLEGRYAEKGYRQLIIVLFFVLMRILKQLQLLQFSITDVIFRQFNI